MCGWECGPANEVLFEAMEKDINSLMAQAHLIGLVAEGVSSDDLRLPGAIAELGVNVEHLAERLLGDWEILCAEAAEPSIHCPRCLKKWTGWRIANGK